MFKILDKLKYADLIEVCHGLFSSWVGYGGITLNLSDDLQQIVFDLENNYPMKRYKKKLVKYIMKRSKREVGNIDDSTLDFLQDIE